jgi:hypothetical protein
MSLASSLANTVGMAIADLIVPEMVPDEGSMQFNVSYTKGNYHMCNWSIALSYFFPVVPYYCLYHHRVRHPHPLYSSPTQNPSILQRLQSPWTSTTSSQDSMDSGHQFQLFDHLFGIRRPVRSRQYRHIILTPNRPTLRHLVWRRWLSWCSIHCRRYSRCCWNRALHWSHKVTQVGAPRVCPNCRLFVPSFAHGW